MDGMPAWVAKTGEIERLLTLEADDIILIMAQEQLTRARQEREWVQAQAYPSSTVPKDVVERLARMRIMAAGQMLGLVGRAIKW